MFVKILSPFAYYAFERLEFIENINHYNSLDQRITASYIVTYYILYVCSPMIYS